jgi:hypothetical protein
MKYTERNGLRILSSEFGYLIHNKTSDTYSSIVYLGKFASLDDFEDVEDGECDKRLKEKINNIDKENITQYEIMDTTMLALDEIFIIIEPILTMSMMSISSKDVKEVRNPMVELYVVMIQRGLKTIDQVPERYRAEVQALLDELEK